MIGFFVHDEEILLIWGRRCNAVDSCDAKKMDKRKKTKLLKKE